MKFHRALDHLPLSIPIPLSGSPMPRVTNAQQALDGGLYSIKLDYSRLALIPEDVADPFFTFDCVLLEKGAYKSDVKFIYKSSAVVRKVPLFTKVVYQDDQEGIVVYCQDTDLVSGGTKSGKYIGVINLPLKARQYKTETDVFYLGEAELKTVKSMSERPATEIPDLEGFVKSFQPYKRMGVKSLDDLDEFRKLDYTERVQRCVEAAAERTNTYCEEHAKGAPGIQAKIRAEREDRLKVHRGRVDSTLARETLAKPFAKRFIHMQVLSPRKLRPADGPKPSAAAKPSVDGPALSAAAQSAFAGAGTAAAPDPPQPSSAPQHQPAPTNGTTRPLFGSSISAAGLGVQARHQLLLGRHSTIGSAQPQSVQPRPPLPPLNGQRPAASRPPLGGQPRAASRLALSGQPPSFALPSSSGQCSAPASAPDTAPASAPDPAPAPSLPAAPPAAATASTANTTSTAPLATSNGEEFDFDLPPAMTRPKPFTQKRPPRGAPDPSPATEGKRPRSTKASDPTSGSKENAGSKKRTNESKIGMKYNTVGRQLAAMREALQAKGGAGSSLSPLNPSMASLLGMEEEAGSGSASPCTNDKPVLALMI